MPNVVCINCNNLGHELSDCQENICCCICKSIVHLAPRCPYSSGCGSHQARDISLSDEEGAGSVAANVAESVVDNVA